MLYSFSSQVNDGTMRPFETIALIVKVKPSFGFCLWSGSHGLTDNLNRRWLKSFGKQVYLFLCYHFGNMDTEFRTASSWFYQCGIFKLPGSKVI